MPEEFLGERRKAEEEKYFYERDRKLVAKLQAKADAERKELERKHRKDAHWMKCPKCGGDMEEVKRGPLLLERCKECGGIFFDAGELEMLLAAERDNSVLRRIFGR